MNYYLGIDCGGTKTAIVLGSSDGQLCGELRLGAASYRQKGAVNVAETLVQGIAGLLEPRGISRQEVGGIAVGLPCYGESAIGDRTLEALLRERLSPMPLALYNDVVVGWAGSLGLSPGINLVAGTGSIAYGRDQNGHSARCGGWDEFFSDEGSCYWLGRKALELFSKQSDGRLPRGPLHKAFLRRFELEEDFQLIDKIVPQVSTSREEVAKLQLLLEQAALAGDEAAIAAYESAAGELSLIVAGAKQKLDFKGLCPVSYSGGLFRAGELILAPLVRQLEALGCCVSKPVFTPWVGALLLACQSFCPDLTDKFAHSLKSGGAPRDT